MFSRKSSILALIFIVCFLFMGCQSSTSTPVISPASGTPEPTQQPISTAPATTQMDIMVDGEGSDWQAYPLEIFSDAIGDNISGTPDISDIRAFNSEEFFYLSLDFDQLGNFQAIILRVDVDGGDYDYTIDSRPWAGKFTNFGSSLKDGSGSVKLGYISLFLGFDDTIEMKIPLEELSAQSVQKVAACTLVLVNEQATWGDCLEAAEIGYAEVAQNAIPNESIYALKWGGVGALHGVIAEAEYSFERIYDAPVTPFVVRVNPEGKLLLLGHEFNCLYELHQDGTTSLYATFPFDIWSFNFDPNGTLWVLAKDEFRYFFVDESGIVRNVTNGIWPIFTFDSTGNMFAMETNLEEIWKITPQGEKSLFSSGFTTVGVPMLLAVTPNDELLVREAYGNLILVHLDGTKEVLTDQLTVGESGILFGLDGLLYSIGWTNLQTFDLTSRQVEILDWYGPYSGNGNDFVQDQDGNLIVYHGNFPIIRVDLQDHTAEVIYHNRGETTALVVDGNHNVYAAYGNQMPNGFTTIYKITDGQLEEVLSVPYGWKRALAIDVEGKGYFCVADSEKGGMIYSVDLHTGTYAEFYQPESYWPNSISIEPATGLPYWTGNGNAIFHMTESGVVARESGPTPTNSETLLAFAPDGTLYVFEMWQKLYRKETDGSWTLLYEHGNGIINIHALAVGPDNVIYIAANNSGNLIPGGREYGSTASIFRVDGINNLTLIGYDFPFDIFAIDVDPVSGDILFSNSDGIFRLYVE